jgi:hypothetical protein
MRRRRPTRHPLALIAAPLALVAGMLALEAAPARAADIQWANDQGGPWNDPANWSPKQVPTFEDRALITLPGSYVVDVSSIDVLSAAELVLGGPGSAPTLHLAPASFLSIEAGAEIRAGAKLVLDAEAIFSAYGGGTVAGRVEGIRATFGTEGISILTSGELAIIEMGLSTTIVNDGLVHAEGMCSFGTFVNGPSGTFEARTGPGLFPGAFMDTLMNAGRASFGPSIQVGGAVLSNEVGGVIELEPGTTANAETFRNAGVWRVAPGASLVGVNFEQLATGELAPGYAAGSVQYAILCPNVTLDGTLAPVFDAAFTPPPGNLPLAFKETLSGQFAIVSPAGTHGVAVDAAYLDQVYVQVLGPGIAITPPGGGDAGPVSTLISGCDLTTVTTARLTRAGEAAIVAEPLSRDPKTGTIHATFDLTGAALGPWSVELEGPGGTQIAADAFTIAVPTVVTAPVRVEWMGRSVLRLGGTSEWSLAFMNPNPNDVVGAVQITVPGGLGWELLAQRPAKAGDRGVAGKFAAPTTLVVPNVLVPPGVSLSGVRVKLALPADTPLGSGRLQARWYAP